MNVTYRLLVLVELADLLLALLNVRRELIEHLALFCREGITHRRTYFLFQRFQLDLGRLYLALNVLLCEVQSLEAVLGLLLLPRERVQLLEERLPVLSELLDGALGLANFSRQVGDLLVQSVLLPSNSLLPLSVRLKLRSPALQLPGRLKPRSLRVDIPARKRPFPILLVAFERDRRQLVRPSIGIANVQILHENSLIEDLLNGRLVQGIVAQLVDPVDLARQFS